MQPELNLDLGNDLHMRALATEDAALLAEATSGETAPALWGPRPAGPYSPREARVALAAWDPAAEGQFSVGILRGPQLLGAVGLMPDRPGNTFEQRLSRHCRDWSFEDAERDSWHDCLIWTHESVSSPRG